MARRRAVDAILVHARDRWGRSVPDLVLTMAEIEALGVAFVVLGHIDMTTPMGRPPAIKLRVKEGLCLIDQGKTFREAAIKTGVSVSTLVRAKCSIQALSAERKHA